MSRLRQCSSSAASVNSGAAVSGNSPASLGSGAIRCQAPATRAGTIAVSPRGIPPGPRSWPSSTSPAPRAWTEDRTRRKEGAPAPRPSQVRRAEARQQELSSTSVHPIESEEDSAQVPTSLVSLTAPAPLRMPEDVSSQCHESRWPPCRCHRDQCEAAGRRRCRSIVGERQHGPSHCLCADSPGDPPDSCHELPSARLRPTQVYSTSAEEGR